MIELGFSAVFTEAIFLIASVALACSVAAYFFHLSGLLQSNLNQIVGDVRMSLSIQVEIVYATIESNPSPHYVLYVKNVGRCAIYEYDDFDVYVGEYGKAKLFKYGDAPGEGKFTIEDSDGDGVWEVGETVVIRAYTSSISGEVFEARVKPFRGFTSIYVFPKPP